MDLFPDTKSYPTVEEVEHCLLMLCTYQQCLYAKNDQELIPVAPDSTFSFPVEAARGSKKAISNSQQS